MLFLRWGIVIIATATSGKARYYLGVALECFADMGEEFVGKFRVLTEEGARGVIATAELHLGTGVTTGREVTV
jgi:hypothetical protein